MTPQKLTLISSSICPSMKKSQKVAFQTHNFFLEFKTPQFFGSNFHQKISFSKMCHYATSRQHYSLFILLNRTIEVDIVLKAEASRTNMSHSRTVFSHLFWLVENQQKEWFQQDGAYEQSCLKWPLLGGSLVYKISLG